MLKIFPKYFQNTRKRLCFRGMKGYFACCLLPGVMRFLVFKQSIVSVNCSYSRSCFRLPFWRCSNNARRFRSSCCVTSCCNSFLSCFMFFMLPAARCWDIRTSSVMWQHSPPIVDLLGNLLQHWRDLIARFGVLQPDFDNRLLRMLLLIYAFCHVFFFVLSVRNRTTSLPGLRYVFRNQYSFSHFSASFLNFRGGSLKFLFFRSRKTVLYQIALIAEKCPYKQYNFKVSVFSTSRQTYLAWWVEYTHIECCCWYTGRLWYWFWVCSLVTGNTYARAG